MCMTVVEDFPHGPFLDALHMALHAVLGACSRLMTILRHARSVLDTLGYSNNALIQYPASPGKPVALQGWAAPLSQLPPL